MSDVMMVVVRNPLVAHVWRLMPGRNVYRNWYLGRGSFVRSNPDVRAFVKSYIETQDSAPAIGNLFSATERLIRAALKKEKVKGAILTSTLPILLEYCISSKHKFLNLNGMCCDVRSKFLLNMFRKQIEHGDYSHDQRELSKSGWNPNDAEDPDPEYLKLIDDRLLHPHAQLCMIFDRVDPETGHFSKDWEPREFKDCPLKQHNDQGDWTGEQPTVVAST